MYWVSIDDHRFVQEIHKTNKKMRRMHHAGFPMRSALDMGTCYKIVHGGSREIGFI